MAVFCPVDDCPQFDVGRRACCKVYSWDNLVKKRGLGEVDPNCPWWEEYSTEELRDGGVLTRPWRTQPWAISEENDRSNMAKWETENETGLLLVLGIIWFLILPAIASGLSWLIAPGLCWGRLIITPFLSNFFLASLLAMMIFFIVGALASITGAGR